ncbi:MAG TPA: hypothetical protein VIF34_05610 [Methylocystis sp.]|jgi:hypothetical protein
MTGRVVIIRAKILEVDGEDERVLVTPTDGGPSFTIPVADVLSFQDHETLSTGQLAPVRAADPASA